jgi:hypothetical protein
LFFEAEHLGEAKNVFLKYRFATIHTPSNVYKVLAAPSSIH